MSLLIFGIVCAVLLAIGAWLDEKCLIGVFEPLGIVFMWIGGLGISATFVVWFVLICSGLGLISL